jgi:hypothetical protein
MLLIAKKPPDELRIINIGPEQTGKLPLKQAGSSYLHTAYAVKVNLNVYDRLGVGIPDRQYYCINSDGSIDLKLKSLSASILHEFTHCLHHVEDSGRYDIYRAKDSLPKENSWGTKEELRTISGYVDPGIFDPICDNCFHMYDSIVNNKPYLPRIGLWIQV